MLHKGVVEKSVGKVFLSRIFTVPKKDSDTARLILDLSRLASHIKTFSSQGLHEGLQDSRPSP